MSKITANSDGTYNLAAGTYAIGGMTGEGGLYEMAHPDADMDFCFSAVATPAIIIDHASSGIDLLLLPFGADSFGVRNRIVQVGRYGFVGGFGLFISPVIKTKYDLVDDFSGTSDTAAVMTFPTDVKVVLEGTQIRIGNLVLDAERPGFYETGGVLVDMSEPGLAEILGYGESATFDEHGLRMYIEKGDERIAKLRALGTPTALALAKQAEDDMIGCLYHHRGPRQAEVRLAV